MALRHTLIGLAATMALTACVEGTGMPPTAQRPGGQIKLHLTPPPVSGTDGTVINPPMVDWVEKFKHESLEYKLLEKCGGFYDSDRARPFRSVYAKREKTDYRVNWTAKIAESKQHLANGPKTLDCWTRNLPALTQRRTEEYAEFDAYVNTLLNGSGVLRKELGTTYWRKQFIKDRLYALDPEPYPADLDLLRNATPRPTLDAELADVQRRLADYPTYAAKNREDIAFATRARSENRASWARAATWALNDFAQDNTFNRPPPGAEFARRTASMYPGVSPAVMASLDAMDRTVFGDAAMNRVLAQEARSYRPKRGSDGLWQNDGPALRLETCSEKTATDKFGNSHSVRSCTSEDPDAAQSRLTDQVEGWEARVDRISQERAALRARQLEAIRRVTKDAPRVTAPQPQPSTPCPQGKSCAVYQ